jgi:hypothetical protein
MPRSGAALLPAAGFLLRRDSAETHGNRSTKQAEMPAKIRSFDALPSRQLRGHRSVESDSHKTFEFSARKSCVKKRMRIRDEPSGGSHQTGGLMAIPKTAEFPGIREGLRLRFSPADAVARTTCRSPRSRLVRRIRPGHNSVHIRESLRVRCREEWFPLRLSRLDSHAYPLSPLP